MPGMAICHFHSTSTNVGSVVSSRAPYGLAYPPSYLALIAHKNLMTALECGFTTVVSAGGACEVEPGLRQAIEDGWVAGPRFTPGGREISTTGHFNDTVIPWYWELPQLGGARNCDGPDGFQLAVRDEVRKGVQVVKLFVTAGHGWGEATDSMEMTKQELATAIETAHDRGVLVRGHIASKRAILLAIELGIDCVDHCDEMDDEVIAALAETGTYAAPTLGVPKGNVAIMEAQSPGSGAAVRASIESMCEALPKAEAAGVRLLLGDDYGSSSLRHGDYGEELHIYVEDAGLTPLSVIKWATRNGADFARRGDELGTVEAGKLADFLIIDGDPAQDISVLADKRPLAVVKGGEVVSGALPDRGDRWET
jgi:imidazolonepropionase-like amidohydrolase